jgi:hypothetical protein
VRHVDRALKFCTMVPSICRPLSMQLASCHPLRWLPYFQGKQLCTPGWMGNIKTSVKITKLRVSTEFVRFITGINSGLCRSVFFQRRGISRISKNQLLRNSLLRAEGLSLHACKKYLLTYLLTYSMEQSTS